MIMTKIRNLVHGGGQSGVPSNLRATHITAPKFASTEEKLREALKLVNLNKERSFTLEYFGVTLGYAPKSGMGKKIMDELLKAQYVRSEEDGYGLIKWYLTAKGYKYLQIPKQDQPAMTETIKGVRPAPGLPTEPGRQRKINKNTIRRYRLMLRYISEHERNRVTQSDLAKIAGYTNLTGAVSLALKDLKEMGLLRQEGTQSAKFWLTDLGHKWLSRKSFAEDSEHTGEVTITKPSEPMELEVTPEPTETVSKPIETPVAPSNHNEAALATLVDNLLWDFLKQYNRDTVTTGNAVGVLRDFQAWLKDQSSSKE